MARVTALLSLVFFTQAGGGHNTSYRAEVAPLLRERPDLAKPLKDFQFADTGEGVRVSLLQSKRLAGRHVGPYEFSAVDKKHGGKVVNVKFRTRQRFVNPYGVVVAEIFDGELLSGGEFRNAVSVQEELVGITITASR